MKYLIGLLLLASPVFAQQTDDLAAARRLNAVLQQQRNIAFDALALSDAKAAGLVEELAKANDKIKQLEAKEKK